jgi:hypothetical protein
VGYRQPELRYLNHTSRARSLVILTPHSSPFAADSTNEGRIVVDSQLSLLLFGITKVSNILLEPSNNFSGYHRLSCPDFDFDRHQLSAGTLAWV